MDKSSLTNLLRFPGYGQLIVTDAAVLSCGCLTSESLFSNECMKYCPNCHASDVSILAQIEPLRQLYNILSIQGPIPSPHGERRRRSDTKKNSKGDDHSAQLPSKMTESMNLLTLFHKYAKEEQSGSYSTEASSTTAPIDIVGKQNQFEDESYTTTHDTPSTHSVSVSPQNFRQQGTQLSQQKQPDPNFETLLEHVSEQKEYNFSKCFPFHRKVLSFPTSQLKLNIGTVNPFKLGSFGIKRSINTSIHTFIDFHKGLEITRFVLLGEKKWELFEYVLPSSETNTAHIRPVLICCGKSTGEYGESQSNLRSPNIPGDHETIKSNDFCTSGKGSQLSKDDLKKRLSSWDQTYCQLTKDFLVISGTKGVMRVININSEGKYQLGEPIYTYLTNFPIRCIAISPNGTLVACSITGRERISDKEQPFIVLHRMVVGEDSWAKFVDPILIAVPYRDPIKIIRFNGSSSHIICATVWESRYIIIKLKDSEKGYQKPRLVWSDLPFKSGSRQEEGGNTTLDRGEGADDELMMASEGITDIQFGQMYSNMVMITSNIIGHRPPVLIRLHGTQIDSSRHDSDNDGFSIDNSFSSREEDGSYSMLKSSEVMLKFPEVGSSIHVAALSPRGDGIVFVDEDGRLYLVSAPNLSQQSGTTGGSSKKIVVLLGEAANAERFTEAASVQFSADGGKVFTVDRKGLFQVFDFTKGVPGEDLDVVKCKILSV
ncbi:PTR3 [Candida metapsilosis]|uniref:PTR3 n=1 Tax=Candida metapsilosis TaxID=273372 RepID=A0A8H8DE58_9ASCO|nr:PTR3 [Candida metapsilosis]